MKKIDTFLFFGDISINHTNLFSINKKIEFLEASNKNIQNENITLKTEIEKVKAGIEILQNENVALKAEMENIKKSINQFLKSEKKMDYQKVKKKCRKKKELLQLVIRYFLYLKSINMIRIMRNYNQKFKKY